MRISCGVLAIAIAAGTGGAFAQAVFLCTGEGRSFAVLGPDGAPGCRAIADPERELLLAPAQPDLNAITRQLAAQSARIDRLEQLLIGRRPSISMPTPRPRSDPFDTRGRTRDLGQDLDRRLDGLGR